MPGSVSQVDEFDALWANRMARHKIRVSELFGTAAVFVTHSWVAPGSVYNIVSYRMPQHTTNLVSPTRRVKLIPPNPADDEAVSILRSHPITRRYLPFLPPDLSIESIRLRREERAEDPDLVDFYIYTLTEDAPESYAFAGIAGIFKIEAEHASCETGIILSPELHRAGYATEAMYLVLEYAFGEWGMHRMTFETAEANEAMRGWLERVLGATLEARKRECWRGLDGTYLDVFSYSILEWEWRGGVREKLERLISGHRGGKRPASV